MGSSQTICVPQGIFCPCLLILVAKFPPLPPALQAEVTSRCELSIRTPKVPNWEHWQWTCVVFRYTSSQSLAVQKPDGLVLQPPKSRTRLGERADEHGAWGRNCRGTISKVFLPADTAALPQLKYRSQSPAGTPPCPTSRNEAPGRGQNPPHPSAAQAHSLSRAERLWELGAACGKQLKASGLWGSAEPSHGQLTGWSGSTGRREACSCWPSPAGETPAREGCPGAPAGRCDC